MAPNGGTRVGTQFGPYELQSLIGVGGMGEVYRAYDTGRERLVAIKLLRTEVAADQSFQERFRRESRVAARLQEPHVIPVHDFGDIDGVLYIDMRLVEGASLKDDLLAKGALPPTRAVSIISQVAAALDAAHGNGLVHRDIKPENVLLTSDDFAYLVDFGIAHGGGEANVTSTGLVIGSCAYMAPERFSGGRGGPAADVYSLTCLLYECLTGRAPFEAGDVRQMMGAHMFSPPPRPSIMRRGISRAYDDVVAKGMAKKPTDRYTTAGELAKAAADASADLSPVPAPVPPSPPNGTRQFSAVDPNPARTGYQQPYTAVAGAGIGAAEQEVAVRPDADRAGGHDDRDVRRGRGPRDSPGLRRPRWRVDTADHTRCATARDDDGHDHAIAVGGVVVHHTHDDGAVHQLRTHLGRVRNRRAGVRRAHGALRRGKHACGGNQDREFPCRGV